MAELFFITAMIANGLLFIPQGLNIYRQKHAEEVSPITFIGFLAIQLAYILHGYVNNDHLLFYGMMLSVATNGWVIYLILYYRYLRKPSH